MKIDKTAPLAFALARPFILWPPDGQLAHVDISVFAKDFLSGSEGFRLVSVVSNDPKQTPDDIVDWTVGTDDTEDRLRAEGAGRGRDRLYVLTYEAVDRAGNTARATATVLVPNPRWW